MVQKILLDTIFDFFPFPRLSDLENLGGNVL